jgi:hypothetical protein
MSIAVDCRSLPLFNFGGLAVVGVDFFIFSVMTDPNVALHPESRLILDSGRFFHRSPRQRPSKQAENGQKLGNQRLGKLALENRKNRQFPVCAKTTVRSSSKPRKLLYQRLSATNISVE